MNNHIKIIQENGSFVGYLLRAGEVIFSTPPCSDAGVASKLVSEHLNVLSNTAPVPVPNPSPANIPQTHSPTAPTVTITAPPVRSGGCGCKRG